MNLMWNFVKYGAKTSFFSESFHKSCILSLPARLKPTRPPSSFGLYLQERKNTFTPSTGVSTDKRYNFMRTVANEWRSLEFSVKEEYAIKAQQAMASYKELMNSLSDEEKQEVLEEKKDKNMKKSKRKLKQEKKALGLPKHHLSAYCFFTRHLHASDFRSSNHSPTQFIRAASTKWRLLPIEEKEKFAEMAEQDKKRYLTEMEQYVRKLREEGKVELIPHPYRKKWLEGSATWKNLNETLSMK